MKLPLFSLKKEQIFSTETKLILYIKKSQTITVRQLPSMIDERKRVS